MSNETLTCALPADLLASFSRFVETTEDDESYDIGAEAVEALASWGLVRRRGTTAVYEVTRLGQIVASLSPKDSADAPAVAEVPMPAAAMESLHDALKASVTFLPDGPVVEVPKGFHAYDEARRFLNLPQGDLQCARLADFLNDVCCRAISWDRQQRAETADAAPDEARFEELSALFAQAVVDYSFACDVKANQEAKRKWDAAFEALRAHYRATRLAPQQAAAFPEWYGMNKPWPLHNVLLKLIDAANILLDKKSYDGHGHEAIQIARSRAEEIVTALGILPEYAARYRQSPAPAKAEATNTAADLQEWSDRELGGYVKNALESSTSIDQCGRVMRRFINSMYPRLVPAETAKPVAEQKP